MKQVLTTREQLNKIVQGVNADIASDFAIKKKDFAMGMLLTLHTQHVMDAVCDILFGKEENNEEKTGCKEDPHTQN